MNIKNAFLHRDPKEELDMKLPPRVNGSSKHEVCGLWRSLYGLKQTPQTDSCMSHFTQSKNDSSMLHRPSSRITVLVYVDDISIS